MHVLFADDEPSLQNPMRLELPRMGFDVTVCPDGLTAVAALEKNKVDCMLLDLDMPGLRGTEVIGKAREMGLDTDAIVMTGKSSLESAVTALRHGAFDYITKPAKLADLRRLLERVAEKREMMNKYRAVKHQLERVEGKSRLIGDSEAMQGIKTRIEKVAPTNSTVLILGETGTGKELVARALHDQSLRADMPFVAVNCGGLPENLVESELFGHRKGAFTGANNQRQGRFEQADGGTLFLDEIGDMPPEAQTRLLRVLSDGEFYRVGGRVPIKTDVRIIAATHQNLEQLVAENRFREDLFHRLNVIRIHIPTLNERREDIPLLTTHFLQVAANELGETPKSISDDTMDYLSKLPWQGNVRQLENFCRWITVMASGRQVRMEDLPPELLDVSDNDEGGNTNWEKSLSTWATRQLSTIQPGGPGLLDTATPTFEKIVIDAALKQTGGRKRDAAKLLGWGRNTLTRKMSQLGMNDDLEEEYEGSES